jgi:hypothetical protein
VVTTVKVKLAIVVPVNTTEVGVTIKPTEGMGVTVTGVAGARPRTTATPMLSPTALKLPCGKAFTEYCVRAKVLGAGVPNNWELGPASENTTVSVIVVKMGENGKTGTLVSSTVASKTVDENVTVEGVNTKYVEVNEIEKL